MRKHTKYWYKKDLADELAEYYQETTIIHKWSELSDVVYVFTRAKWNGYDIDFPFNRWQFLLGLIYMLPKYSDRFIFFKMAGRRAEAKKDLHEVRNPRRIRKLDHIAKKYEIDPSKFKAICEKQLKYWPLLP